MIRSARNIGLFIALSAAVTNAHAWQDSRAPWVFDLPKGGTNCSSLVTVPDDTRYDVNFEADIRPQLQALCNTCHINGGSGGLNMNFTNARLNLIGANETGTPAQGNNQRLRVRPFVPTDSVLFEKLNCANPPFGGVMPPGGGDTIGLQKLIHDWIAAGALMPDSPGGERMFIGNFEPIVRPTPPAP
jgi:hypothetical protein